MRRRLAVPLAVLALAAGLPVPGAHAQGGSSFLDAYKAGVAAVEAEDWPTAERLMRTAVAGRAEEAERLVRHLHLKPYIPHFYLGLALAEQGRCEEALASFAESEGQGVVTALGDEMAVLRAREATCRAHLEERAAAEERRQAVVDLVARAQAAAGSIAALADDPVLAPGWDRGEPSLAARLDEVQETIARARQQLAGAAPPGDAELAAATDLARGALGQIEAMRKESELRRHAAAQEGEKAAVRLAALVGTGRDLLDATRDLARTAPTLARRRDALTVAVEQAAEAPDDLPASKLQEIAGVLQRRIAELRTAAAPPPEALVAAAAAWLRGEPEEVLAMLGGAEGPDGAPAFADPRAQAHALLLRSAAAFSLHEAAVEPADEILAAARRDAAACRRLEPELVPVPSAFSPRFRAFFAAIESAQPPT